MATRRATSAKRQDLADRIRADCDSGRLRPGQMLPTVRELQVSYGLSSRVVHEELRKLVAEGVLHSRPRVGTFVAEREVLHPDTYVMAIPEDLGLFTWPEMVERVRIGFEDEITQLGGATVVLGVPAAGLEPAGELPSVAGIFAAGAKDAGELRAVVPEVVPRVRWQTVPLSPERHIAQDTVAPDHHGAGRAATDHLLRRGHHRIGFLGAHAGADESPQRNHWSALGEGGWREALELAGQSWAGLGFRPVEATEDRGAQLDVMITTARPMVARRDITAVVCSGTKATQGLVAALREAGVPADAWPTLVTLGDADSEVSAFTTSIRIPYEELGRTAARMLWQRVHGELVGPSRHHVVTMPIVRRADNDYAWLSVARGH